MSDRGRQCTLSRGCPPAIEREGITVVDVASTEPRPSSELRSSGPTSRSSTSTWEAKAGFELARELAEEPAPLPVILISTRSEDELVELIENIAGAWLSLPKQTSRRTPSVTSSRCDTCVHEAFVYSTGGRSSSRQPSRSSARDWKPRRASACRAKETNLNALREALDADAGSVDPRRLDRVVSQPAAGLPGLRPLMSADASRRMPSACGSSVSPCGRGPPPAQSPNGSVTSLPF